MMDFDSLSNDEIRDKLLALGKKVGPVNGTNRSLYVKMLASGGKKTRTSPRKSQSPSPRRAVTKQTTGKQPSYSILDDSDSDNKYSFNSSGNRSRGFDSSTTSTTSRGSRVSNIFPGSGGDSYSRRSGIDRSYVDEIIKRHTPDPKTYFEDSDRFVSHRSNGQTPVARYSNNKTSNYPAEPAFVVPKKKKGTPGFVPPVAAGFLFFLALVIFYYSYSNKVHEGVSHAHNFLTNILLFGYTYGVIPVVGVVSISLAAYVMYYLFNIHRTRTMKYQEEVQALIKEMMKSIRRAGKDGLPIRQLRDKMMPAYNRTSGQLKMWNAAESFIKQQDTRVRTEERLINDADIAEFFVWSAPFSDDYE